MGILDFFRHMIDDDDEEYELEDELDDELEEEYYDDSDDGRIDGGDDEEDYEYIERYSTKDTDDSDSEYYKRLEKNAPGRVDISSFDDSDIHSYIKSQGDIIKDAANEIDMADEEYDTVTSYFSDIQLIDAAPDDVRDDIEKTAEQIAELTVDRRIYRTGENRISQHTFFRMERLEPHMPDALIEFQNNEAYCETVRKDMRMLEGEMMSLRADARDLIRKQKSVLSMAKMSAIGLFFVFCIFIIASVAMGEIAGILFTIVISLSAFIAIGLLWMLQNTKRQFAITQKKINRAEVLLNKVKIKYVNIASTVDYQCEKYGVKNSYELSSQYELYLDVRKEQQRIARMTEQLSDSEIHLEGILKSLSLYDPHIWLAQVKALIDPKEMVEVRHGLSTRRQKLRARIKYNQNRIDEARADIAGAAAAHPEYSDEVQIILDQYAHR